jgi:ribosomal protein S18 acetylase RimI-like enzyme
MDPISGTWAAGPGREYLRLHFDGSARVSGTVMSGSPDTPAPIDHGTFDPATRRLRLAGVASPPGGRDAWPFLIEARLTATNRMAVSFHFGEHRGAVTLWRPTPWRRLGWHMAAAVEQGMRRLEPLLIPLVRFSRALRRPSAAANLRRLAARGETIDALTFRDARPHDIPALAALHVKTWAATYPGVRHPPTFDIRERQWRDAFAHVDGRWFCVAIENARGDLVGFAKGVVRDDGTGDLNKIYLLVEYQRLGLGRRLLDEVARRFLACGVTSITVSADPANPSCGFYVATGAVPIRAGDGRVERGNYVWRDLRRLIAPGQGAATSSGTSDRT